MKYNFPKLPFFLSIVLLIFSCSSLVFLYTKIKNTNQISTQMIKEWQTENKRRDNMKSLDRLIQSVSQEKALLDTHFAQSSDVVPFLNMIEKLAPQTGAKAQIILVDVSKDKKSLVVRVEASGSFESVYKFLVLLENSPYELELASLDIQELPSNNTIDNKKIKVPQWSMTLEMRLLSFIQ